jgi:hypothetical protein
MSSVIMLSMDLLLLDGVSGSCVCDTDESVGLKRTCGLDPLTVQV